MEQNNQSQTQPINDDSTQAPVSAAQSQLELEAIIHRYVRDIQASRERTKEKKSMLDASYENDAKYQEADEAVKKANKVKKEIQQRIRNLESVKLLTQELNDMKEEIKDMQEALSQYLKQYQDQTGSRYVTGEDGEMLEIINTRRLVKKKD